MVISVNIYVLAKAWPKPAHPIKHDTGNILHIKSLFGHVMDLIYATAYIPAWNAVGLPSVPVVSMMMMTKAAAKADSLTYISL